MAKKKRISVQSAKAKGRKFQNLVGNKIAELLGMPFGKDELIASRPMGQAGTDIVLKGKALDEFPFSVECKHQESWSMHSWIDQARKNEIKGADWLLFCKRNRSKPIVVMDMESFFEFMLTLRNQED